MPRIAGNSKSLCYGSSRFFHPVCDPFSIGNSMSTNFPQTSPPQSDKPVEKIPPLIHLACGWPLVMVAIGGAIGGALGGAAYGINMAIYKSKLPVVVKVIL